MRGRRSLFNTSLPIQSGQVEVTAQGKLSDRDKKAIEEGATRSPVHHIFSRALKMDTRFAYVS